MKTPLVLRFFFVFFFILSNSKKTIEIKPTWAKGYSRKGAVLYSLKRMTEAKICYEEALKIFPKNAFFISMDHTLWQFIKIHFKKNKIKIINKKFTESFSWTWEM